MTPVRSNTLRGVALVLVAVVVALLAVEALARFVIPRVSKIESRVDAESAAARRIDDAATGERTVLLLGNSLLEASVRLPELQATLRQGGWVAKRYIIEDTSYLDWYYGLRHQLQSGHRPSAVVLMLSAKEVVANTLRGTYSTYHLLSPGDAFEAAHRIGMHPTQVVGQVIGSVSAYYGLRTEIRQFFLRRVVPSVDEVAAVVAAQSHRKRRESEQSVSDAVVAQRLDDLKALCDAYRVRCFFNLATELEPAPWAPRLIDLAEARGLATRELQPAPVYGPADFQADRFHMSEAGAGKYTPDYAARLAHALASRPATP